MDNETTEVYVTCACCCTRKPVELIIDSSAVFIGVCLDCLHRLGYIKKEEAKQE